jgi:hypothetical protein
MRRTSASLLRNGRRLLDGLSPSDIEGFSSFHVFIRTLSPLIPRR